MGIVEDTLAHWRKQRADLAVRLADPEDGKTFHSARRDAEWVDVTPELVREWTEQIAELDRLISKYDA
jgi:hypothetical protein